MDFILSTEGTSDLREDMIKDLSVRVVPMEYCLNGECYLQDSGAFTIKEFYEEMRNGASTHTSQLTCETFNAYFEKIGAEGKDVLHISFASACSSTYMNALSAANNYNASHKNKIYVLDSKAESGGQGLLVMIARDYAKNNKSAKETYAYVETMRNRVNMLFTVDNLKYLVRGGRVKKTTAFVANILRIKPLLYVNEEGQLIQKATVISRKVSLLQLVKKVSVMYDGAYDTVYICHADCEDDAEYVKRKLSEVINAKIEIGDIGHVIGSHSGPGTLAIYFTASSRYFPK